MPDRPNARTRTSTRPVLRLAVVAAILALASPLAFAQEGQTHAERNRAFYGPGYFARSYAASAGIPRRLWNENGGYYGPPQIYSRQYGRLNGYQTARPFTRPRAFGGTGYGSQYVD